MQLHGAWPDALRRGAAGLRAAPATGQPAAGAALLPAGRAAPAARRVRRGRGGVPRGQPVGTRARSPDWRCCGWPRVRSMPPRAAIRRVVDEAEGRAGRARLLAGVRRDHARRRRRRRRPGRRRRAGGDRRRRSTRRCCTPLAAHAAGRRPARARATPGPRSPRCAAAWTAWQELEAPYEAARVRVLHRPRLPAARRRGHRGDGARRGALGLRAARRRARPRASARRSPRTGGGRSRRAG